MIRALIGQLIYCLDDFDVSTIIKDCMPLVVAYVNGIGKEEAQFGRQVDKRKEK